LGVVVVTNMQWVRQQDVYAASLHDRLYESLTREERDFVGFTSTGFNAFGRAFRRSQQRDRWDHGAANLRRGIAVKLGRVLRDEPATVAGRAANISVRTSVAISRDAL
jgi:hypothetical protein